jgi:hypothetical protein
MIVASFFAPRPEHPRWRDYLPSLRLLQASCDRLGLTHVIIGDAQPLLIYAGQPKVSGGN